MNRKKQFIAFVVSTIVTVGLWMVFHGRPHYAQHCHGQQHTCEQSAMHENQIQ